MEGAVEDGPALGGKVASALLKMRDMGGAVGVCGSVLDRLKESKENSRRNLNGNLRKITLWHLIYSLEIIDASIYMLFTAFVYTIFVQSSLTFAACLPHQQHLRLITHSRCRISIIDWHHSMPSPNPNQKQSRSSLSKRQLTRILPRARSQRLDSIIPLGHHRLLLTIALAFYAIWNWEDGTKMMIHSRNMLRGRGVLGQKCFVRSRLRREREIGAMTNIRKYIRLKPYGF